MPIDYVSDYEQVTGKARAVEAAPVVETKVIDATDVTVEHGQVETA